MGAQKRAWEPSEARKEPVVPHEALKPVSLGLVPYEAHKACPLMGEWVGLMNTQA